jgi:hypothetical protein
MSKPLSFLVAIARVTKKAFLMVYERRKKKKVNKKFLNYSQTLAPIPINLFHIFLAILALSLFTTLLASLTQFFRFSRFRTTK